MSRELPLLNPDPHPAVAPGVRLAMPVEAEQIAAIQRREWADDQRLAGLLNELTLADMAQIWHQAIVRPPLAHNRVLVATQPEGAPVATGRENETALASRVVGYAVVQPSSDDDAHPGVDGEVAAFRIDPIGRGLGHTSRLMNAAVDTLRADGYSRARCWVTTDDDDFRALLVDTGWGPDGAHREVGTEDESVRIKQVRLATDLSTDEA